MNKKLVKKCRGWGETCHLKGQDEQRRKKRGKRKLGRKKVGGNGQPALDAKRPKFRLLQPRP